MFVRKWNSLKTLSLIAGFTVGLGAAGFSEVRQVAAQQPANSWADERIDTVRDEFPQANLRITGQERTPQRQAELMLDRAQGDRQDFLQTYRNAPYAQQMDQWVRENPTATRQESVSQFTQYVNDARQQGYRVSNHLPSPDGTIVARDVSIPRGGPTTRTQVENRLNQLGCNVLRETNAATGPHWHVDCNRDAGPGDNRASGTIRMDENAPANMTAPAIKPRTLGRTAPTASLRF